MKGAMMRKVVLSFGLLLATAGCQVQSEEDMIEGSIRNTLSSQGNIQEVEITKQGENNFSGFAVVRDARGQNNRLNCTASRNADKAANFDWRCLPTVDETTLTNVETAIRESLSQQSNVRQVDMTRQDDSNMTGFAVLQLADGSQVRSTCTARRENETSANFDWRCGPGEPVGAEAPAAGGDGDKDGK